MIFKFKFNKGIKRKTNYNSSLSIYFRIIREALLPNIIFFSIAIIFMMLNASSIGYRAYLIKPAVDKVFLSKDLHELFLIPVQLIGIGIFISFTSYFQGLIMNKTTQLIAIDYKRQLFSKIITLDMDYFQNRSSHKILDLFNDVEGMMVALNLILTGIIKEFLSMVVLIGVMIYQNFFLSICAFIGFPLIVYPAYVLGRHMKNISRQGREISSGLNSVIGESLSLIELVKSNSSEKHELIKFNHFINTTYRISMNMIRKSLISSPMVELAGTIGFAGVIWFGGKSVINGTMTTGSFFTFITALLSVYRPAKSFANINIQIQNALTCAKRLFIILDKKPLIKDKKNAINMENIKGNIFFKNIYFQYPIHDKNESLVIEKEKIVLSNKIALNNLSIDIKSGSSVALVGHSGSGKSTIFKLLQRFYDPVKGDVLIDNYNLKDITTKSLHSNIAVVSQNVLICNDSVKNNVRYGRFNATDEEVIKACELANANEFINELEDKYDTILGPNGSLLSGGQKQRISIARAILKNAPILLLDEATSALDPISEKLIQKALKRLMKDKTTIIIAHRLTTVQNCDKIFVLQEGELVEEGSHIELLKMNGIYANLYKKQFEKSI